MRTACLVFAAAPALAGVLTLGGCAGSRSTAAAPDTIAAQVAGHDMPSVRDAWRSLGIYDSDSFHAAGMSEDYKSGPFSARVFHLEIDGRNDSANGTDAVVRIGDPAEWDWQYLVFANRPSGWKFLGKIDLPNNRLEDPKPESIVMGPDRAWLIVHSLRSGRGRDAHPTAPGSQTQYETRWFQAKGDTLVEVLRLPGHGRRADAGLPFSVTYRAEVVDTFFTPQNQPAVTYRVEAAYSHDGEPGSGPGTLFQREGVVRFVQSATGRFVMDSSHSAWTEGQLAGLATDGPDDFLKHNARQVAELARSQDPAKRLWVGRLLAQCGDSAQKDQIVSEMGEMRE